MKRFLTICGVLVACAALEGRQALTASITPKAVTCTPVVADKVYDGTTSATIVSLTIVGAIPGDVVSCTGGLASFANKQVGQAKPVTVIGITLAGAAAANYTIPASASTTASITRKGVTVVGLTAQNKTYDGTTVAQLTTATASLSGVIAGDQVSLTAAVGAFADPNVGTNKPVTVSGLTLAGADAGNYVLGGSAPPPPPPPTPPPTVGLVQPTSVTYSYSFRLPCPSPCSDPTSFNYGGNAAGIPATFNPSGNGGQGSLMIAGKIENGLAGEVSIPAAVTGATTLAQLPTATVLSSSGQLFDPTGGHRTDVGQGQDFFGGFIYFAGKFITSVLAYYDGNGAATLSHVVSDGVSYAYQSGPWQVGTRGAGWVAGAMTLVPQAFVSALGGPALTCQCCLAVVTRTSEGPSCSVFDPSTLGSTVPALATLLLGYPACGTGSDSCGTESLGDWIGTAGANGLKLFNLATWYPGVVAIDRSLIFAGHLGVGVPCYGVATNNTSLWGQPGAPDANFPNWCGDPTVGAQAGPGGFDTAYQNEFLAYDLNDLAAVKAGTKKASDVLPYASWSITLPITPNTKGIAGLACDTATRRLFVLEAFGDGTAPLVHVYSIA